MRELIDEIKGCTGKWIIIRGPDGFDWIGLIGEIRVSTNPWSNHSLEMLVAWNKGEPSWHEIVITKGTYQPTSSIRPMLPPNYSWLMGIGFRSRNSHDFEGFDIDGGSGKPFRIVDSPEAR